jgi:tetratricopeptide (TPR) repeat protein
MIKANADSEAERRLIEQYEAEQPAPAPPSAQTEDEAERQMIEQYEAEQPAPVPPAAQTEDEAEAERRMIQQYEAEQPAPVPPAAQTEDEAEAERRLIEAYEAERAPARAEEIPEPGEPSTPGSDLQVAETYSRGLSVYRNRRYQDALDEFRKVAAAEPDRADIHYLIGYCHLMLRQYEQSLAAFRQSFSNDPNFDPRSIYQLPPSP